MERPRSPRRICFSRTSSGMLRGLRPELGLFARDRAPDQFHDFGDASRVGVDDRRAFRHAQRRGGAVAIVRVPANHLRVDLLEGLWVPLADEVAMLAPGPFLGGRVEVKL